MLVTDDLKWIVKSGKPSEDSMVQAYEDIANEYGELSKDTHRAYVFSLVKEIRINSNKLMVIQALVDSLSKHHHPELTKRLRQQGFNFQYNPTDPEKYMRELKLTISQSKTLFLRTQSRCNDLEKIQSNKTETQKVNESEYDILLSKLSKFQGYRLNAKEISVSEFISIFNQYKDYAKSRSSK